LTDPLRARLADLVAAWRLKATLVAHPLIAGAFEQCVRDLVGALRELPATATLKDAAQAVVTAFLAWHTRPDVWVSDDLLHALSDLCDVVEPGYENRVSDVR
jgi:hypothetical protein